MRIPDHRCGQGPDKGGRRHPHLETRLSAEALPNIATFLAGFAGQRKRGEAMSERLGEVGRATVQPLLDPGDGDAVGNARNLLVTARHGGDGATLEFVAATEATNLENGIAALADWRQSRGEQGEDGPLELLRDYTSSVRHHRYCDTDAITLRVDPG